MKSTDRLKLHSKVYRLFDSIENSTASRFGDAVADGTRQDWYAAVHIGGTLRRSLQEATIFDCRGVSEDFVADTGDAVLHEIEQTRALVRVPFRSCYLEFNDTMMLLEEFAPDTFDLEIERAVPTNPIITVTQFDARDQAAMVWALHNRIEFSNGERITLMCEEDSPDGVEVPFVRTESETAMDARQRHICALALGFLELLNEKLLAIEFAPDPAPQLTKRRLKNGRYPLTAARQIVTLNLAAVRRIAKRPEGTHESPCLHWRRGHSRVLHRGSEFESKTWVKRCLVGDPSRGYVSRDYRLVHQSPLLRESAA